MKAPTDHSSPIRKVAIVGPECTGKTELSKSLAQHFKTEWAPEYARSFMNKLNRPYEKSDLVKIAHGQLRLEDEWIQSANSVLFCDTNLLVIKIWSDHKFGDTDPEILKLMSTRRYDLLLLTNIDIPWEDDPQREHPDKREHFWNLYKKEAADSGVPVVEISGQHEERKKKAVEAVDNLLKNPQS